MVAALQIQYNRERQNGAGYDILAGAFEYMNLSGLAAFMAKNGDEERQHAKLFFDYISDLGEQPRVDALPATPLTLTKNVFADTLSKSDDKENPWDCIPDADAREIVRLWSEDCLTAQEIANRLNKPFSTVNNTITATRKDHGEKIVPYHRSKSV